MLKIERTLNKSSSRGELRTLFYTYSKSELLRFLNKFRNEESITNKNSIFFKESINFTILSGENKPLSLTSSQNRG
ncbi:hypothetical protein COU54_04740 [Candidatus Pacearchaeota archaeon CG10_big_fil_rev_8_21_14_0_10_31_24]|nr:MAG: hypothetical protein COU54_04740 [Candidatus Pacearchaeota archaeon CG10_big_fil_rev_8_21_14_0_10_31_24]